ncbi:MAG: hypothetical protein ABI972_08055 [Acidobacteriota bacterium]
MEDAARVLIGEVEPAPQPFLRPLSALAILAIDWWLFGGVALTFGLGLFFELTIGAVLAAVMVAMLQSRSGDKKWFWKALLAAFIVGIPTPVAGTSYALVVLGLAGIKEAMDVIRGMQSSPAAHRPPPPR